MIKVTRKELCEALSCVSGCVGSDSKLPIVKTVRLSQRDGKLYLLTTNTEAYAQCAISSVEEGEQTEDFCIDFAALNNFANKSGGEILEVVPMENKQVKLLSGGSDLLFPIMDADQFPNLPSLSKEAIGFKLQEKALRHITGHTSFCVSKDASKPPVLQGVNLKLMKDNLMSCGIDGYRIALHITKLEKEVSKEEGKAISINVPGVWLQKVASSIKTAKDDAICDIKFDNKFFVVKFESSMYILKLIEGSYLPYENMLPAQSKFKTGITVKKDELLSAMALIESFGHDKVKLSLSDGNLTLSSKGEANQIKKDIDVEQQGEDVEISFSIKFLSEGLKAFESETVLLYVADKMAPAQLIPGTMYPFKYIVFPVAEKK